MWDARHERVLWVDIDGCAAWARPWPDGPVTLIHRAERAVCAILPADDGGLVIVEADRLVRQDESGAVSGERVVDLGDARRFNDATVDPQGRLLVGTLSLTGRSESQELFRLEPDGRFARVREGLSLSNGLGFSPDGTRMYHVDTMRRRIDVLDATDDAPIAITEWTVEGGYPDGLAVDAEGFVWVALWGGSAVVRLDPSGRVVDGVPVPAPHTTSVAFVGSALDELLITTAFVGRAEPADADGGVYRCPAGVAGVDVPAWRTQPLSTMS
ncbi:SMP-30/gluconolactonase/LRE family protein [Microbacterium awajiense]|uniref:SMP-30/gluconolactonase/LRE family protein n=1 Tax=Microbacterium awajiense TaxID=415214 RepID=A0ABP7ATA4_9MICO